MPMRYGSPIAADSTRGRTVLFSGLDVPADTWEWDGSDWHEMQPPSPVPGRRSEHVLVQDVVPGRVLLFGGYRVSGGLGADTWTWDGTTWTQLTPSASPPARERAAAAYDSGRNRVVLFGGRGQFQLALGDTWEWDGTTWLLRTPAVSPRPRDRAGMAYDAARGRTVLFGGWLSATSETWEWDGSNWTQRFPTTSPAPRSMSPMSYDPRRQRVVLFGGYSAANVILDDTWEWDGSNWLQQTTATPQPRRALHGMCFDPVLGQVLVHGGADSNNSFRADTWGWNGTQWTSLWASPPYLDGAVMMENTATGRVLLCSGAQNTFSETYDWDGTRWRIVANPTSALAYSSSSAAGAFDAGRQRYVVFGGERGGGLLALTQEWDGTRWQVFAAGGPSGRQAHAMAYDSVRRVVVLFGGSDNTGDVRDTWAWNGTVWQAMSPSQSPPARHGHVLFEEPGGGRLILHGGEDGTALYNDTWAWDGTNWAQLTPAGSPPAAHSAAIAVDRGRRRAVLTGGLMAGNIASSMVWEWDGGSWVQRTPSSSQGPGPRWQHLTACTGQGRLLFLFGRWGQSSTFYDAWTYGPDHPAAWNPVGIACTGSAGTPVLTGDLPWLGDQFTARITNLPASSTVMLLLGSSRSSWGSLRLPLDLAAWGMPGCTLYTNGILLVPVSVQGGSGVATVTVPNAANLLGVPFYAQALATDPPANPVGVVLSNAGEGRVGSR